MKKTAYNLGYFLKEGKTLFKIDFLSNLLSILSIGLIFFILALVVSGWGISNYIIGIIEKEAEINVYFDNQLESEKIASLIEDIESTEGVERVTLVSEEQSYNRMVDILGNEANILELFDENPFTSFIEVQIHIEKADSILDRMENINGIDYIRDNKRVIDRLQDIVIILKVLGVLVLLAVGVSTLIVISHIIRQGIYNNREQINTLELLGAPEFFIGFPFLLEGLFLTVVGGGIASLLFRWTLKYGYGQMQSALPFIPFPPGQSLSTNVIILIVGMSVILGIVGSLFGLSKHSSK
ncbi:cell division protein FtsX [Schnuerera sp.]|uniref:cell division protein FtsX n=1 Tax=Schnuerera sp. TaxID=2794844 RepID=UPI002C78A57A|nr:permease-like cell division protein FtsX [Schnuerera sp.]HSH35954.1 permease-like cell division protein FtsX [Schnuerera sp.]